MGFRLSLATLWLFTLLAAVSTAAAQTPFSGTWKLNQEKSQLAGDILRFGPAAGNAIELTSGGAAYSFRTDGQTYATPSGNAAVWRQTAPDSWTTEYRKLDNTLLHIDHWKLSSDGKTLTVTTSGTKANGDLYSDTTVYARSDDSVGLMGNWQSTSVTLSSPGDLVIEEQGLGRLALRMNAINARADLLMDGKDTVVTGPDVPAGLRWSLTRTGPYSFQLVQKLNGTTSDSSVYTVAADNPKLMTQVGGSPGNPPATHVWEKQDPPEPKKAPVVGVPLRP